MSGKKRERGGGGSTGKEEGAMAEEIIQRQRGAGETGCRQTAERHLQMEGEIGEGGSKGEESGKGEESSGVIRAGVE